MGEDSQATPSQVEMSIYLPSHIFWQADQVDKVVAEGLEGYFTLLPRHIDYVSVLVPGILNVHSAGVDSLFAVDHGTLVKQGSTVRIATRNCVQGTDIKTLSAIVDQEFRELDDMERKVRTALTGLEHAIVQCRSLLEQGARGLHFYTLNKADSTGAVMRNVGLCK